MPKLALVVCPLPVEGGSASAARRLLQELEAGEAVLFCPEPYQAPADWQQRFPVLPLADLPARRAAGEVSAPVYLLDGGPAESALQRYRQQVPGVEIDAGAAESAAGLQAAAAAVRAEPAVRPLPGGPRVEAMVLAYRSRDYLAPCLDSLLDQDWPDLDVTVLDNASGDGTADFVRQRYPQIRVIESRENLGFTGGHNEMFRRSRADFFALLNHDAQARANWISELVLAAQAAPGAAVFGSKMLMRRCPTVLNSTGIVMNESGFAADRDIGRRDLDPAAAPQRVFAVSGGAMLLRREVVERLGGFDPAFFMYVEDVDLCWRARLLGHEILHVPTAVVLHDWHGDLAAAAAPAGDESEAVVAEREGRRRFLVERNRLQAVYKNYERGNLRRVWRELHRHDRGRLEALRQQVARGGGPLPARVLEAVQQAHRWCRRHRFGLWRRRRATQRLREVPDSAYRDLIAEGCHEPSAVGDLHAIVDRHCAEGRASIAMAASDRGCLGPGWHHAEPGEDGAPGRRWSMAEAWFYLRAERPWQTLVIETAAQPRPTFAELEVGGVPAGRLEVPAGAPQRLAFRVEPAIAAGELAECRLWCQAFVPLREGLGGDPRELGLCVTRIAVDGDQPEDQTIGK